MIPRKLHVVWIGDDSKRPVENIESWRSLNPDLELTVWDNVALQARKWHTSHHMPAMWERELAGVADMMRYEILYYEGGITIDADSRCLRKLDDFLFEHDPFACWENEISRAGLISNAFMGASPGNKLIAALVDEIAQSPSVTNKLAWEETGPLRLTQCVQRLRYADLTVFPSHFFIPNHTHTGQHYRGTGRVYADHQWLSTQVLLQTKGAKGITVEQRLVQKQPST